MVTKQTSLGDLCLTGLPRRRAFKLAGAAAPDALISAEAGVVDIHSRFARRPAGALSGEWQLLALRSGRPKPEW